MSIEFNKYEIEPRQIRSLEYLDQPLGVIDYSHMDDPIEVSKPPYNLKIQATLATDDQRQLFDISPINLEGVDLLALEDLDFSKNGAEDSLSVRDNLPQGWQVFFVDQAIENAPPAIIDMNKKIIFINGAITSPRSIISLMHECGHANIGNEDGLYDVVEVPRDPVLAREFEKDRAVKALKNEWKSWEYALQRFQKILDSEDARGFAIYFQDAIEIAKQCIATYEADVQRFE